MHVLRPQATWLAQRHLQTLAWRMVGLIQAAGISLTAGTPSGVSRAPEAQRTVRRWRRGRTTAKLDGFSWSGPLMTQARAEWGEQARAGALAPSMW